MPTVAEMRASLLAGAAPKEPSVEEMRASLLGQPASTGAVIQEQHPDISNMERFNIKNFGGDTQQAISYLQKAHPDMQFSVQPGDQIAAKHPAEKDWRVLDPDQGFLGSFTHPVEALKDVGDVAADTLVGLGSGAAATTAGLGTGLVTGGTGAIPAAMAAGGAAGSGLEYLRQKIGQLTGVQDPAQLDKLAIGLSGGLGAASPLLLGTGATKGAISDLLKGEGTGILSRLGGEGAVTKALGNEGLGSLAGTEAGRTAAADALYEGQRGVSKYLPKVASGLTGVPEEVIKEAPAKVTDSIKDLLGMDPRSKATNLQIAEKIYQNGDANLITDAKKQIFDKVQAKTGELQDQIGAALKESGQAFDYAPYMAKFEELAKKQPDNAIGGKTAAEIRQISTDLFGKGGIADAPTAMQVKNQLADIAGYVKGRNMSPADGAVETAARDVWRDMTKDLSAAINKADQKAGGNGALTAMYKDNETLKRDILPAFKTDASTERSLAKFDKASQRVFTRNAKILDKKYGTSIEDVSNLLDIEKHLANPSFMPTSGGGTTSTTRTITSAGLGALAGYGLGNAAGGGPVGSRVGGGAGFVAGGLLGGPAALRQVLRAYTKTQPVSDLLRSLGTGASKVGAPVSAWELMRGPK